jgi:hypothetical protein
MSKMCDRVVVFRGRKWFGYDASEKREPLDKTAAWFGKKGYLTKVVRCPKPAGYGLYLRPDLRKAQRSEAKVLVRKEMNRYGVTINERGW